ncbi:unnamed protein product [Eruca vesicaria subsp. sativa]|uniref:Uncharacterized protein n=1 Tax=Eruca vesicaria subsp. sativa TaxID=29727 RepID=A0ABC8K1H5_ERUVS|nr:unnamed protein product [Eruca vesicaria subsp. sativa]
MPPRRKAKQIVKLTEEENRDEGIQREDDQEAERQIAAIKAIRDVEIEQSLTALRLLCSYYAEEQLQKPVLEFFKENLPAISFHEENGEILFKWNDKCVRSTLLGTDNTHLRNLVFLRTSENRMLVSYDALRTPEAYVFMICTPFLFSVENCDHISRVLSLNDISFVNFAGKWAKALFSNDTNDSEATKTWRDDALCAWLSFGVL